jgi:hypothetical protein
MKYTIKNIEKLSFNKYNSLHWAKKKEFKDNLRKLVAEATDNLQLDGGYHLKFEFQFIGRRLDTINTFHYSKIIEDFIFKQDCDNGDITLAKPIKGLINQVVLTLIKIDEPS